MSAMVASTTENGWGGAARWPRCAPNGVAATSAASSVAVEIGVGFMAAEMGVAGAVGKRATYDVSRRLRRLTYGVDDTGAGSSHRQSTGAHHAFPRHSRRPVALVVIRRPA